MSVSGFPLLLIPLAIYNMLAFLTPGFGWTDPLMTVRMISNAEWRIDAGDIFIAVSTLVLFGAIVKAARLGVRSIVGHLLSLLLFVGMAAEFLMVPQAATSTFFLLALMGFVDVIGGFMITIGRAKRAVKIEPERAAA